MKSLIRASLLLVALAGPVHGQVQRATDAIQPSVDDFIKMKSFPIEMPISLSPDGKTLAYTIQDGARIGNITDPESMDERPGSGRGTRGCEIWVLEIEGGAPLRISDPQSSSWGAVWSPNGENLAYFSDTGRRARPWVWDRRTRQSRPIADVRPQFVDEHDVPRWAADGKSIFFRAASERTRAIARIRQRIKDDIEWPPPLVLDSPERGADQLETGAATNVTALGVTNTYAGDLVQVQIESGTVTTITKERQIYGYWPSPDGTRLVFTVGLGYKEGDTDWTLFDVIVRDLVAGRETIAAHEVELDNSGCALSWSPDGSRFAYGTIAGSDNGTRYWIWPGEGQASTAIGDAPTLKYPEFPLWNPKGDRVYVFSREAVYAFSLKDRATPIVRRASQNFTITALFGSQANRTIWSETADGNVIYEAERNTDSLDFEVHRLDISKGRDELLWRRDAALAILPMEIIDSTRDGDTLVFPMESPQAPQDLWVVKSGFTRLRQLTHINPQLENYAFPQRRVVHWVDFDGHDLRGTLFLPAGYVEGHAYPLIVYIYGGERESRWANQFAATSSESVENMQLFATRGYAVLVADTWMGTESPMLDLLKSLMPGIDKMINLGIADRSALGVMGHSYGAYGVYGLTVQTNLFRAGVALSGSGNLLSDYGEMDPSGFPTGIAWAEQSQGRMRETPWKVRDKYIENSPFFYLQRVETPILIAHGDSDWHPAYEDREMFVALRRLGKYAEYAEYRGEGHRISAWRYTDQLDLANRILGWFDRYLRHAALPPRSKAESSRLSTAGK